MSLTTLLKTFDDEKTVVKDGPKYVEKTAAGISLKGVLQRGRLRLRKDKPMWKQGVSFRPSGMTYKFCRRAKIAQLAGLLDLYDSPPAPKLALVFDMGHAIHDIIQGYFWDIGLLRGSFKCLKCDVIYDDLLAPTACPSGIKSHTRSHLKYKEIQLENKEHLIRGRCDGILDIDGVQHIMDIKSIANRALNTPEQQFTFEDLERGPKPDHVVQLNLYMWMSGVHNGHLLYVAKNDHRIKTFSIPYDHSVIAPYLTELLYLITTSRQLEAGEKVKLPAPCDNEACMCHTILSKKPA